VRRSQSGIVRNGLGTEIEALTELPNPESLGLSGIDVADLPPLSTLGLPSVIDRG